MTSSTFNYGGITFPLTTSGSNTLLQDADPAIFYALDFCSTMLATYIEDRLVIEAAVAGVSSIAAAVASAIPYDPAPRLAEQQFKFPLLAIYRIRNSYVWKTMGYSHEDSIWGITYILPPLKDAQAERLLPILHTVPIVLLNRMDNGHDPSYSSDAQVWDANHAGIDRMIIAGSAKGSFGAYPGANNLLFPAWTGEIGVRERLMPSTGTPLTGIDVEEDLKPTTGATINDFVDFASDVPKPGPATG